MAVDNADLFLKLVNAQNAMISGECTDKVFKGWIELENFELSTRSMADCQKEDQLKEVMQNNSEGGDGQATTTTTGNVDKLVDKTGKTENRAVSLKITKPTDLSSPWLALSYSQNLRSDKDTFPSAILVARKRGGTAGALIFFKLLLKNLYVVNYNLNLTGGKDASGTSLADEDIQFVFESFALKYIQQGKSGRGTSASGSPNSSSWSFKDKKPDSDLESKLSDPVP